jgi:hypothetical protein
LSIIWNAALAYVLLVSLPAGFGANLGTVLLFQPDVGWAAVISGIFAMVLAVISTGIGISILRQPAPMIPMALEIESEPGEFFRRIRLAVVLVKITDGFVY